MKLVKGFGLLSFLTILSGSCFDPPEFPIVPEIEFERIEFIPGSSPGVSDSLNLYIRFRDGDGDLGLSKSSQDNSDPFHSANFYQENNGEIEPLTTERGQIEGVEFDLLIIPNPEKGKLVFYRTRLNPAYADNLPPGDICFTQPGGAVVYKYYENLIGLNGKDGRRVLIRSSDRAVLDDLVTLVDSFPKESPQYYQIKDTLYYTPNPDHYNIEVDFLVKDPTAPEGFTEFDWREAYCLNFDGRFPVLSDNPNSVDGTLKYSMVSLGLRTQFSIKTLKLRVRIKDYLRHESNVIYTEEFTLL